MTFIEANVLKLNDRVVLEKHYNSVIDYLSERYPNGFGEKNCTISVNGIEQKIENYDVLLAKDATVVLMFHPALAVGVIGGSVVTFIANLLISAAVSYVIGQIFKPSMPELQTSLASRNSAGQASSVYSLNSQQNEAKAGAVIPVIYGRVRVYPALICPPYYRYEDNEEYLYQLMCIGQGKYNVEQVLISDTDAMGIQRDYFKYETLEYDDFKTVQGIKDKVLAPNYNGLVKTIPDVDNLELRGTPQNKSMIMRFENDTITFYPYSDGSEPDLSSLSNGSTITITESDSNDGVYTVDSVLDNVVTVQSHTFVTEPTDSKVFTWTKGSSRDNLKEEATFFQRVHIEDLGQKTTITKHNLGLLTGNYFTVTETTNNSGVVFQVLSETTEKTNIDGAVSGYFDDGETSYNYYAKSYGAEFETSYGTFSYDKEHIGFEVDIVYPNGVYNTNDAGDFEARDTESDIMIKNDNIDLTEIVTTSGKIDNSSIRITYKYIYEDKGHTALQPNMYLNFKRITPEPSDIKSMDKTYISRVKFILEEKNYESLGNLTLMWCKIRATNAISSIGQFAINAWVNRSDVSNDVSSVLTDLYTNNVYGGRLPSLDLDLDETAGDVVNGAIDSKMTLFDAMQMVAKSNRYTVFPVGNDVKLKHDSIKPLRTALYNETNILKDSLKISYLFEEMDETDSIKITYRDSTEFKEVTAIYPIDGIFPEEIELWGCTDESVALAMATYLFKQDRARRKSVEFKTDIQGLIPQFLDRIAISHNIPNWGLGGQIVSVSGNNIILDCDFDMIARTFNCDDTFDCLEIFCKSNNFDTILFRDEVGGVSDTYNFTIVNGREIQLTDTAPSWLNTTDDYDNTFFSVGSMDSAVKDYIVTGVKPNGNEIAISAVNYDETIYN